MGESLRNLAASCLVLARQRLELAALDVEEELARATLAVITMLAVAALGALCLAALSAATVVALWDTAPVAALLAVAALHGGAAAVLASRLRRALADKPVFLSATLQELRQDGDQLVKGAP